MMYTYLENIDTVKTRYNFPYNLIGKIKDIQLCKDGSIPFYRFTLFNDNIKKEYTCIVKESLFEKARIEEYDSIVIEYVKLDKFMNIGPCFLIRKINKPVMNLTGNKNLDILTLMNHTKELIESEYKDDTLIQSYHQQINKSYLAFRKSYLNSRKKVK